MARQHPDPVRARLEDGQILHTAANFVYGSLRNGHGSGILLLEEAGQAYIDTLAMDCGLPAPVPGSLSERALGLSVRDAVPHIGLDLIEGLRRIDRAARHLRRPEAAELADVSHRSTAWDFVEVQKDLRAFHAFVRVAIGWPLRSGDYRDQLAAQARGADAEAPSPA